MKLDNLNNRNYCMVIEVKIWKFYHFYARHHTKDCVRNVVISKTTFLHVTMHYHLLRAILIILVANSRVTRDNIIVLVIIC